MNLYLIALAVRYGGDGRDPLYPPEWDVTYMRDVFTDRHEAERSLDFYADIFAPEGDVYTYPRCIQIVEVAPVQDRPCKHVNVSMHVLHRGARSTARCFDCGETVDFTCDDFMDITH